MNMVIYVDLERPGEKGAMVYFDALFPNSLTGPKKTASNRMADVLRKTRHMYFPLISSCRLNQLFITIRTYRISAVRCLFLGAKNRVPSAGSQSAPCSEQNGNEQVLLREHGLSLPFPFRQCSMLIYHKVSCPYIGCPTRYRTRNFFNNFTTGWRIAAPCRNN